MGIWIATGGSLGDGAGGGGSTMKDLAPDGYDYYILSDGSGDNTDVNAGLVEVLGSGAGHYRVYIGPGSFAVPWETAFPADVSVTLHGAGKKETTLVMSGSAAFGSPSSTKGFAEVAYMSFSATDWDGWMELNSYGLGGAMATLADGSISPDSFHDCSVTYNKTTGQHEWAFMYASNFNIYNCEFSGNHGVAVDGDGAIYVMQETNVRDCSFSMPDGVALWADGVMITGCKFRGAGSGSYDYCISTDADDSMIIEGCQFYRTDNSHAIRVEGVEVRVSNCQFPYISQVNAFTLVSGGTVIDDGNAFLGGTFS